MRSSSPSPAPPATTANTTSTPTPIPIRILTHNIRYATDSPFPGERLWPDRKDRLIAELRYHTRHCPTAIICLQEVLHSQLLDILEGLNGPGPPPSGPHSHSHSSSPPPSPREESKWTSLGVGRDDGKTAGEYSPILFRHEVWEVTRGFTMWLSPTPWTPGSKGWDAASVRIVTVAVLAYRGSGGGGRRRRKMLAMNTHLDDQGLVSRFEGAKLIVQTFREVFAAEEGNGVGGQLEGGFLAGDLNSEVTGEAYLVFNERGSGLVDLGTSVDEDEIRSGYRYGDRYGDEMTFTGFNGQGDGEGRKTKIDFIHLSTETAPEGSHQSATAMRPPEPGRHAGAPWAVQGYAVLPNRFDDGVYLSDHRAVVGDVLLMPRA